MASAKSDHGESDKESPSVFVTSEEMKQIKPSGHLTGDKNGDEKEIDPRPAVVKPSTSCESGVPSTPQAVIEGGSAQKRKLNVVSYRHTDMNLSQLPLATKPKKKDQSFPVHEEYYKFCYYQDHFWFPGAGEISVYTKTGNLARKIETRDTCLMFALHPFTFNKMLVAAYVGLHLLDITLGTSIKCLLKGHFQDVHASGDKIVALEYVVKPQVVHILDATNPPTPVSSFSLGYNDASRVLLHNQCVYVTAGFDNAIRIYVYSLQGEELRQYVKPPKYKISSTRENLGPYLCSVDSHDNMLIIDFIYKQLVVLDSQGEFKEVRGVDVVEPWDVIIADGDLYVLHDYPEACVQKYKL